MTNRWAVLGLLCFARVSMGLNFQSVAAVAPLLISSLGLTYAQLGALIGLYTVPGIFLSLPGGLLAARFGDRAAVLAALGLLTLGGLLFANGGSFGTVLLARLIVGAGGVILSVQLTKITTDWFAGKEIFGAPVPVVALPSEVLRPESRSTGFGVWQTVYHVGMAVVPPLAGFLLDVTRSARAPLVFAGVLWLLIIPPLVGFRSVARRGATAAGAPKL